MLKHLILRAILRYKARGGGRRFCVDCNFEPTCSTYAYEAIERFGVIRGGLLAWNRLRRCYQPDSVCKCYEPVPEEQDHAQQG